MRVSISNVLSLILMITAGVPQGSVLGPILYNFYINDAPKAKWVEECDYADDKAYITSSYRISAIVNRLNKAVKLIFKYYNKWKIKINVRKTEAIIFTKRRPIINCSVNFNNHTIEWSSSVKYLGLILDPKLTFTKHVNYVSNKALSLLLKYYPLLNRNSMLSKENKLNIYKVLVRPAMMHACPVWSMTCNSNFSSLQIQQNKFMRLAGNFRKFTEINQMHKILKLETVYEHVRNKTVKYFENIKDHPNKLMKLKTIRGRHKTVTHILK